MKVQINHIMEGWIKDNWILEYLFDYMLMLFKSYKNLAKEYLRMNLKLG